MFKFLLNFKKIIQREHEVFSGDAQAVIDQLFNLQNDGQLENERYKKSILLALLRDLKFSNGRGAFWNDIKLKGYTSHSLNINLPSFTTILLFCSGIDVLARVYYKSKPENGKNGKYFIKCLQKWFGCTRREAKELWSLRNNVSHQYRLSDNSAARQYGGNGFIEENHNRQWVFYLRSMEIILERAVRDVYNYLSSESENEKKKTAAYIQNNCFYFVSKS